MRWGPRELGTGKPTKTGTLVHVKCIGKLGSTPPAKAERRCTVSRGWVGKQSKFSQQTSVFSAKHFRGLGSF